MASRLLILDKLWSWTFTFGVGGAGILFNLVIKGIASGASRITIVQVNATNSNQRNIPLVTRDATIFVKP
jgi:hypothetical protein